MRPVLCFLITFFAAFGFADSVTVSAQRIAPPTIDGVVNPAEWSGATRADKFVDIYTGQLTADQTEAWIGYDDQAIYVAYVAHDSQPDQIVGREIRAGSEFDGEDQLIFRINSFGTHSDGNTSRFAINPLNTQSEQIAGGRSAKREWRGEWQSAVKRTTDGWSAEMRIPWKIIGYPSGNSLTMDINFIRYQARTKVRSMWQNMTSAFRPELMARWTGINPPAKAEDKPWGFMAYAAPEFDDHKLGFRSGLDARYKMGATMTGLVSLNPDFKNIENEIAGIDFSRTERYFDDARPFFTEGSDYFDLTGDYTWGRMFYSRRIGAFDAGAKAFGKLDPTLSVGALTTLDNGKDSATVAKIEKQFDPYTNLSAYATSLSKPGSHNQAAGLNAYHRWGNFWADTQLATEAPRGERADSAGAVGVAYEAPKWFALVRSEWVQPGFDPALGYIPWTDRRGYYVYANYNNEFRSGAIRKIGYDLFAPQFTTYGGKVQERGANLTAFVVTAQDLQVSVGHNRTDYSDGREEYSSIGLTANNSNRFKRFGVGYNFGKRAGDSTSFVNANGSFRVLGRLDLGFDWSQQRYRGTDRLGVVSIGYELNAKESITGRYVNRNGRRNAYLAYRNGGGTGTEYYLILGDPNADTSQARVSVKVVWAF